MINDLFANHNKVAAIAAGPRHTIGLKLDGTVVGVGDNKCGQCDVSSWCGIQLSVKAIGK